MYYVGKIDRKIYSCVTDDITTDEVIITDRQIEHIEERHKGVYNVIEPFFKDALEQPDYILADKGHSNTALILKMIEINDLRFQIVLRLHTAEDEKEFKNSIISAWEVSENRWNNYLKNRKILYKYK